MSSTTASAVIAAPAVKTFPQYVLRALNKNETMAANMAEDLVKVGLDVKHVANLMPKGSPSDLRYLFVDLLSEVAIVEGVEIAGAVYIRRMNVQAQMYAIGVEISHGGRRDLLTGTAEELSAVLRALRDYASLGLVHQIARAIELDAKVNG